MYCAVYSVPNVWLLYLWSYGLFCNKLSVCCIAQPGLAIHHLHRRRHALCAQLNTALSAVSHPPLVEECPCHAGDGFSPRAEDAILHGCLPVVIMDDVDPIFASILDWESFSVRIPEVGTSLSLCRGHVIGMLAEVHTACCATG